ncbi:hypothetical protein MAM1_0076d04370 [Mucor ambiguus]|uniref:Zn(2)-C6 fungal-type domain-containing protein n=1 Tax=Mucor ambiguus TaxID=91626 RepID=A0A0C9MS50_9FUNG|nr:hypothetical protein MAM1_0076d04370 [Mucor ambiguus]
MDYNGIQQSNNSPSLLLSSNGNNMMEPKTILPNKYTSINFRFKLQRQQPGAPCSHCISTGKSDTCSNNETTVLLKSSSRDKILEYKSDKQSSAIKAPKRGYKSHVPSACVNCKTAHLACDVSRPCKRCISLKKEDTCQDMQHKKRGRPKLREKRVYSSNEYTYEILYGTIQEPAIMMKNTSRSIIPNQQAPPFKAKASSHSQQHHPIIPSSPSNSTKRPSIISFVHESFQPPPPCPSPPKSIAAANLSISEINSTDQSALTIDTVAAAIPTVQLSSNPLTSQPLFFNNHISSPAATYNPVLNPSPSPPTSALAITASENQAPSSLIIILSMEVCCAKVSDDTIKCWGYYPQELAHRSLYDFISNKDSDRLARLHRLLIDNAMNVIKSNQTNDAAPLPPTERTTSSLFSNTDQQHLSVIANGSRSFSDTIHIKKRSGEYELYKVIVYIGGGLGADLYDASTLSKQYIVAQFHRHEYEVIVPPPPSSQPTPMATTATVAATSTAFHTGTASLISTSNDNTLLSTDEFAPYYSNNPIQPIAVFSPMSPLTPTSPSNSSITNFGNNHTTSNSSAAIHRPSTTTNLDLFRRDSSFSSNSPTTSNPKFSKISSALHPSLSPKFNIAPTTNTSNSLFHRFQSSSSVSQASSSTTTPVHMQSSSMTVTHPTQQYFLQTSSSTLNAAASAAQNKSRSNIPSQETTVVTSDRKMEMSIRSLLC